MSPEILLKVMTLSVGLGQISVLVCVCGGEHRCHGGYLEVRRHPRGIGPCLLPCLRQVLLCCFATANTKLSRGLQDSPD